jgi:rod shape-determining protein MreB
MPVNISQNPLDCVAKGTGAVLDNIDKLHDILSD